MHSIKTLFGNPRLHRILSVGLRAATLLIVIGHFTLTLAYVMPPNPIKLETQGTLNKTIGIYFEQNWRLFAPDPLTNTQSVMVQCVTRPQWDDMVALGEDATLPEEGWHDVSGALWDGFQRNRFSAYDRLARPFTNAARSFMSGGEMDLG